MSSMEIYGYHKDLLEYLGNSAMDNVQDKQYTLIEKRIQTGSN